MRPRFCSTFQKRPKRRAFVEEGGVTVSGAMEMLEDKD